MSTLESAREGFPNAAPPRDHEEMIHRELVRATVMINNIIKVTSGSTFTENDPEWHDLRAIRAAIGQAQEYTR